MIDTNGFRLAVGIIVCNMQGELFLAKRTYQDAWQFPQGGIHEKESLEAALYRELYEEVGLKPEDVKLLAQTRGWLSYRLPRRLIRSTQLPLCLGQKQKWFLLQLKSSEDVINLDKTNKPEFSDWQWVSYWFPLHQVVAFKREVYRSALKEFAPILMSGRRKKMRLDYLDR